MASKFILPKEVLEQEYCVDGYSIKAIAEKYCVGRGPISKLIKQYNLPVEDYLRDKNSRTIKWNSEQLYSEYVVKKMNLNEISEKYNCNERMVKKMLIKANIQLRSNSEAASIGKKRCRIIDMWDVGKIKTLYEKDKLSIKEISVLYECPVIRMTRFMKDNSVSITNTVGVSRTKSTMRDKGREMFGGGYYDMVTGNPYVGMIRSGYVVSSSSTGPYIWKKCGKCGEGKWVAYKTSTKGKLYWCKKCSPNREDVKSKNRFAQINLSNIKSYTAKKYWENNREKMMKACTNPESRRKRSIQAKARWSDPIEKDRLVKILRSSSSIRPTNPEKQVMAILNELYPNEWKYVGGGEVILGGKNPDIINCNGRKGIIEVNGVYWHSKAHTGECPLLHELRRIDHYKEYGYETLIIWDSELNNQNNVIIKLDNFYSRMDLHMNKKECEVKK